MNPQSLEQEIERARVKISADSVSMSITELSNLYKERVLIIRPEFQRLYRWTDEQKSRLVESLILGIPLPSLFVAQAPDGEWELVDGLQRVSTILELQGLLLDKHGKRLPALTLKSTPYLKNLEGVTFDGSSGQSLTPAQQRDIRLSRLDLKIIKRSSDPNTKFDLFQRLNSFGSTLTPQEIRSAVIAGINSECLAWLTGLAESQNFKTCVSLPERLLEEQYDIELVLRFLMLQEMESPSRQKLSDFSQKLDEWAIDLATHFDLKQARLSRLFDATFSYLADSGGEDLFRKWDVKSRKFKGPFLNTAFETIAIGAGYRMGRNLPLRLDVREASQELSAAWSSRFATGLATADRLVKILPVGRKLMADPPEKIVL